MMKGRRSNYDRPDFGVAVSFVDVVAASSSFLLSASVKDDVFFSIVFLIQNGGHADL